MAELVIRGGTVVDGTGAPGRRADVAVADGRIVGVGEGLDGDRELDASGHVVAPGFIDIHTHYDAQVFWDPDLTPSSFHGVTTVIAGNCGFSIAPIRPEGVGILARTLQHVEDMSFDTLSVGVPWDEFETFPQYLEAVGRRGTALNYGCYVGHTATRLYVMGDEAYERPATPDELDRHAGRGRRRDGRRCHRLRQQRLPHPQRRPGSAGAVTRRRPRRAAPPDGAVARCGSRRRRAAARRGDQERAGLRPATGDRPALHVDGAPHDQGLPLPRGRDRGSRRRPRRRASTCGRRCRAARSCSR